MDVVWISISVFTTKIMIIKTIPQIWSNIIQNPFLLDFHILNFLFKYYIFNLKIQNILSDSYADKDRVVLRCQVCADAVKDADIAANWGIEAYHTFGGTVTCVAEAGLEDLLIYKIFKIFKLRYDLSF
jgi:hypothetical protein